MTSQILLRIPDEMKTALEALARAEDVSLNKLLNRLLQGILEGTGETKPPSSTPDIWQEIESIKARLDALENSDTATDSSVLAPPTIATLPEPEPNGESDTDRILDYLRKHGGKGTRNQISKGKRFTPGSLDAGLAELEATGLIRIERAGNSVKVYLV